MDDVVNLGEGARGGACGVSETPQKNRNGLLRTISVKKLAR